MSTLLSYEQFVDRCNKTLVDKLGEIARSPKPSFDVAKYMQFYAFDVIGEISYVLLQHIKLPKLHSEFLILTLCR